MNGATLAVSLATFCSTLLGGGFALRFHDRLHLIAGFGAGALIGVAFFDLLPGSMALMGPGDTPLPAMTAAAIGYGAYLLLDRLAGHRHLDKTGGVQNARRGVLGAGSLALHSFLDGCAIGLAFKASAAVGVVVAVAVLAHDFADGINTVGLVLRHQGDRGLAKRWLFIDAIAPMVGALSTFTITLPPHALGAALGVFAGFFLYIGASDLLPESYRNHPSLWTTAATIFGIVTLYVVVKLAGAA